MALSPKCLRQARGLSGFSAALGAFERNERACDTRALSSQEKSYRWFKVGAIVMRCSLNSKNGRARDDLLT